MTLAFGIAVGAGMTGFLNAMQHVKVAELYKADLVTSEGKEASMFLATAVRISRDPAGASRDFLGYWTRWSRGRDQVAGSCCLD